MQIEVNKYTEAIPAGIVLSDNESTMEIFVRVQDSKIPANLTQAGTWATRAFRDKGYKVVQWLMADTDSKFQYINAAAIVAPWEGERAKFHWNRVA